MAYSSSIESNTRRVYAEMAERFDAFFGNRHYLKVARRDDSYGDPERVNVSICTLNKLGTEVSHAGFSIRVQPGCCGVIGTFATFLRQIPADKLDDGLALLLDMKEAIVNSEKPGLHIETVRADNERYRKVLAARPNSWVNDASFVNHRTGNRVELWWRVVPAPKKPVEYKDYE